MHELRSHVRALHSRGAFTLPMPGGGQTVERHLALMQLARADLSVARLAEAHTDAMAILSELEKTPGRLGMYGVWASDGPKSRLTAKRRSTGGWSVSGTKLYCSGATIADAALVTAHSDDGILLFDVPLDSYGISVLPSTWVSPAFADTATGPVSFDEVPMPDSALVGAADGYLGRVGFWHGAIGPAACWAGGALSLIDAALMLGRADPHSRAQLGALQSIAWGIEALMIQAGREIDGDGFDLERARVRALKVRHLIERWCTEVMDRFGRATGPELLAYDEHVVRQHAALALYIRQCHGEKDLERIAPSSDQTA